MVRNWCGMGVEKVWLVVGWVQVGVGSVGDDQNSQSSKRSAVYNKTRTYAHCAGTSARIAFDCYFECAVAKKISNLKTQVAKSRRTHNMMGFNRKSSIPTPRSSNYGHVRGF